MGFGISVTVCLKHWNCHVYKWKYKTHLELNMSIAFLYILYCIRHQIFAQEKMIHVEKYVCKAINNERCVIKISMFQTIVGNICQEISWFNFCWTIFSFPARQTSTYCLFRNKTLLLLLLLLLTAVNIMVQEEILA